MGLVGEGEERMSHAPDVNRTRTVDCCPTLEEIVDKLLIPLRLRYSLLTAFAILRGKWT